MPTRGQITLTQVHDLAVLYLSLAHGTDADLEQEELNTIALKLRLWLPDKDPALIDHVIRDATLTYLSGIDAEQVTEIVQRLGNLLSEERRRIVLDDLSDIAQADDVIQDTERAFISRIATAWGLDQDAV